MPKRRTTLQAALLLAMSFALSGCQLASTVQSDQVQYLTEPDTVQQTDKVMIRVANTGSQTIDNLTIHFYAMGDNERGFVQNEETYDSIAPKEVGEYRPIGASFRYAPMEASVDGEQIKAGVTDFVGEFNIPNGNYTYELMYGPVEWDTVNERMDSRLRYDRTPIDRAISRSLEEEITEAIALQYYRDHPDGPESSGLIFSRLYIDCVHQQTHRGSDQSSEQIIVYAKLVCNQPSYRTDPGEPDVQLEALSPIPIRIELQEKEGAIAVTNYQFPRKGTYYEQDMRSLFSAQAIKEINNTAIRDTTRNELKLDGL